MSYGQWVINEILTKQEFGYTSNELTYGSKKPVKCICDSCGRIANKRFRESNRKHKCDPIINGRKKCCKCKEFKLVNEFSKNKHTYDGYQKVCKDCFANYDSVKISYKKRSNNLKQNLKTYLQYYTSRIKKKCEQKNLPFDLEQNTLYDLYCNQNGKCYYTNIDIKHNIGCHQYDSISIDRLNPNLGYTKNNVVLSSFAMNSFKGMMSEIEFKEFLDKIIPKLIEYKNKQWDTKISPFYNVDKTEENDEPEEIESVQLVDVSGNPIPECAPRTADELDVGVAPVSFAALSKLVNLNKAKLVSNRATEKFKYEITGNDKTGVLSKESMLDELIKANDELDGISDIILKETEILELPFSGNTNNNN